MNSAIANRVTLVLSFIGIFVAGVLSLGKILNVSIPCGVGGGCDAVTNHPSSLWFGIPVAYFGLAAYTLFAVVGVLRAYIGPKKILVLAPLAIAAVGALIHVGLAMYAYTVIEETCWWCLSSMATMVLMFIAQAIVAQNQGVFQRNEKLDLFFVVGLAILTTGALGYMGVQLQEGPGAQINAEALKSMTLEKLVPPKAHIYGNPAAPVTVVEFADFFCNGCRHAWPIAKKVVDDSNGTVRLVFRHFPLVGQKGHEYSWPAAVLSEYAADDGKFWEVANLVVATKVADITDDDALVSLGKSVGVNVPDLKERKGDKEDPHFGRVYDDYVLANDLGIRYTPTFIIFAPDERVRAVLEPQLVRTLNHPRYQRFKEPNANR